MHHAGERKIIRCGCQPEVRLVSHGVSCSRQRQIAGRLLVILLFLFLAKGPSVPLAKASGEMKKEPLQAPALMLLCQLCLLCAPWEERCSDSCSDSCSDPALVRGARGGRPPARGALRACCRPRRRLRCRQRSTMTCALSGHSDFPAVSGHLRPPTSFLFRQEHGWDAYLCVSEGEVTTDRNGH